MTIEKTQEHAEGINRKIANLIIQVEKEIIDLKKALKANDYPQKDEDVEDIKTTFQKIIDAINDMYTNIDEIRTAKQGTITTDQAFLSDKLEQLSVMRLNAVELIDFLTPPPSDEEFEQGALEEFLDLINRVIGALNRIRQDDLQLKTIYHSLKE
jgi:hypothetical protein